MKRLMSKSNALRPALNVASVSIKNFERRISARVKPGLIASRTCFTVRRFSSPISRRCAHADAGVAEIHVRQTSLPAARGDHGDVLQHRAFSQKPIPPSGPSSRANSSQTCAESASFGDAPSPARRTMRARFSFETGTIRRFPGGNRRKSGTSTLPATSALPSISVGSTLSKPSFLSISVIASRSISGGGGRSARSNTGGPIGWSRPCARAPPTPRGTR